MLEQHIAKQCLARYGSGASSFGGSAPTLDGHPSDLLRLQHVYGITKTQPLSPPSPTPGTAVVHTKTLKLYWGGIGDASACALRRLPSRIGVVAVELEVKLDGPMAAMDHTTSTWMTTTLPCGKRCDAVRIVLPTRTHSETRCHERLAPQRLCCDRTQTYALSKTHAGIRVCLSNVNET